jgi:hypothetical protein
VCATSLYQANGRLSEDRENAYLCHAPLHDLHHIALLVARTGCVRLLNQPIVTANYNHSRT